MKISSAFLVPVNMFVHKICISSDIFVNNGARSVRCFNNSISPREDIHVLGFQSAVSGASANVSGDVSIERMTIVIIFLQKKKCQYQKMINFIGPLGENQLENGL